MIRKIPKYIDSVSRAKECRRLPMPHHLPPRSNEMKKYTSSYSHLEVRSKMCISLNKLPLITVSKTHPQKSVPPSFPRGEAAIEGNAPLPRTHSPRRLFKPASSFRRQVPMSSLSAFCPSPNYRLICQARRMAQKTDSFRPDTTFEVLQVLDESSAACCTLF